MAIEKIVNNNHSPTEHMLGFRKKKKDFIQGNYFFMRKNQLEKNK